MASDSYDSQLVICKWNRRHNGLSKRHQTTDLAALMAINGCLRRRMLPTDCGLFGSLQILLPRVAKIGLQLSVELNV
jgi:type II secretory pathway component PulJ